MVGTTGGILLGWNEDSFVCLSTSVASFSITVVLENVKDGSSIFISSAYSPSDDPIKLSFWNELRDVRMSFSGPWILCGDFNAMRFQNERLGAQGFRRDTELFNSQIRDLDLIDMSLHGRAFT